MLSSGDPSLLRGSPGTGQGPVSGSGGSTTGPLAPADGNKRQKDHEKPSCCKHIWNPGTNMSLTSPILCSGCSIGERSLGLSSKLFPPVLLLTGSSNIKLAGLAGWLLWPLLNVEIGFRFGSWSLKLASQPRLKHSCRQDSAFWDCRYL